MAQMYTDLRSMQIYFNLFSNKLLTIKFRFVKRKSLTSLKINLGLPNKWTMTRDIIVKSIYLNTNLSDFARRTTKGNDLWQDIISEMLISISEMPESKLIELHRSEGLVNYCYKIIHLSWNSPNSPFYVKYRAKEGDDIRIEGIEVDGYDVEIDVLSRKCDRIIKEIEFDISQKRYPSEVKVFELYTEIGSIRETAKTLKLPVMTVWKMINRFKEKVKSKL